MVSGGDDDSGQLPDQQEPELQDETLLEMGSQIKLKRGQVRQYSLDGADDVVTAKVLDRAGKSTGKYKNSYNVEYKAPENLEGTHAYIDLDRVTNFKIVINISEDVPATTESIIEEIFETKDMDFSEAKMVELQSWKTNEVYDEVPYENQKCISVRWVCRVKSCENGYIYPKARLVVRGFEKDNQNLNKKSPICSNDPFRVINAIVAQKQWKLNTIDIKTAFLQGEELDSEVYLYPPKEAYTNRIWKLKKCVYVLADASLKWYGRVESFLLQNKGKMSVADPAVFYWHNGTELLGIICVHVDDFRWAGVADVADSENDIVNNLRLTFKIGKGETESFKYIGLGINQFEDDVIIDQESYINQLKPTDVSPDRKKRFPFNR